MRAEYRGVKLRSDDSEALPAATGRSESRLTNCRTTGRTLRPWAGRVTKAGARYAVGAGHAGEVERGRQAGIRPGGRPAVEPQAGAPRAPGDGRVEPVRGRPLRRAFLKLGPGIARRVGLGAREFAHQGDEVLLHRARAARVVSARTGPEVRLDRAEGGVEFIKRAHGLDLRVVLRDALAVQWRLVVPSSPVRVAMEGMMGG